MRHTFLIYTLFCLTIFSCQNSNEKTQTTKADTILKKTPAVPAYYNLKILWLDSSKVQLSLDYSLRYKKENINCDSAIAIDYIGFEGEHTFFPINDKGQWINTITRTKRLTQPQEYLIALVIGDKQSYYNPLIIPCYEPRLGIVYFKEGKVIGQTVICLGCSRLESTINIGDPKQEGLINSKARESLSKICKELQFTECMN